jgi:hypothetical protein
MDPFCNISRVCFKCKVPCVEQLYDGVGVVALISFGAAGGKEWVMLTWIS